MDAAFAPRVPPPALPGQAGPSHRSAPTNPFTEFEAAEIEQSIAARFESQMGRHGHRPAIEAADRELTYQALNRAANRVAHAILARHGAGPEPVALLFAPDSGAIAATLGVLKAGKFFVPLDPAYPEARLAVMLMDTQPRLVVTDARHAALARRLCPAGCELLEIDTVAGLATVVTQHLAERNETAAVERWLAELEGHADGPGPPG